MVKSVHSQEVAIVGIGESEIGVLDYSSHALHAQAANRALADAGVDKGEIDELVTCDSYTTPRSRHAVNVAQYIGLHSDRMRYIMTDPHGSTSASGGALTDAILLVRSGMCEMVLVLSGDNWRSEQARMMTKMAEYRNAEFEAVFGVFVPAMFGLIAQRYMHDYGATEDDFAEVAVAQRSWANLTPNGQMRDVRITKDDVLNSRMVATPHRRLNCAIFSDGCSGLVVTTAARAKAWGDRAVTVLANEHVFGSGHGLVSDDMGTVESILNVREASKVSIQRAFNRTGLSAQDMDLIYTYDPFSFMPMLYFESLGLCGTGEGAAFVRGGRIAPGGDIHWNTHGGLHSYCHSGPGGGSFHMIEAVRQLRGDAGPRQKANAETAIYVGEGANWGAFPATILLRGQP